MSFLPRIFFLIAIPLLSPALLFSQSGPPAEKLGTDTNIVPAKQKEFIIINGITLIGNKVTKSHIVLRELPFAVNDTILKQDVSAKLKSAKENVLNTSLFNFVTVDTVSFAGERVTVLVSVAERWYTWPAPIFEVQERNFNTWWKTKNLERANYGFYLNRENFRGRKEDLSFYAQFGYTVKYGLSYSIPYLTRKHISGAGLSFSYARNREVAYMTSNNTLVYFKDTNHYVREEFIGKMHYTYRLGIHMRHYVEGKFTQGRVKDTLQYYSTDYFVNNATQMKYFSLNYSFRSDYRDSRAYPLNGYYWEAEATKLGLGLLKDEKIDVLNFFLTLRDYEKLSNRFYLSSGVKVKFSPTVDQPYYVQRGLGWSDYVRGYEYYVIDGQSYGTAKLGLRYEIIKPRTQKIPHLAWAKFNTFHYALYAGLFGDGGYVDDHRYSLVNPLANSFLYGYGLGIDYVTYYDIVLRMEYSINRMKEHGFFLNFNVGI